MLDSLTLAELRDRIEAATIDDKPLLDAAIEEARELVKSFQALRPRSATPFSLVASDGGHNRLHFNPFSLTFVRVVDSKGKPLMLDAISPRADIDELSARHLQTQSPLGRLLEDLSLDSLRQLSPMLEDRSGNWVLAYRELCEWASLYERIVHRDHANSTVFVRDGLLRTPIFTPPVLVRMCERIVEAIERNRRDERLELFLVGLAKHTEVHSRYELAMSAAGLPDGQACWAPVPQRMQEAVHHRRLAYIEAPDSLARAGGRSRNMGAMHFVRFGPSRRDRIWTVDVLHCQRHEAHKALAALLADAQDGFPIPYYPLSLQKADEHAQIGGFDREVLDDCLVAAVRRRMPSGGEAAVDAMLLSVDPTSRRYE